MQFQGGSRLGLLGKANAIGPVLLGMGSPVHVLQTGDEVNAIMQIASVAVMDSMNRELKSACKAAAKKSLQMKSAKKGPARK